MIKILKYTCMMVIASVALALILISVFMVKNGAFTFGYATRLINSLMILAGSAYIIKMILDWES